MGKASAGSTYLQPYVSMSAYSCSRGEGLRGQHVPATYVGMPATVGMSTCNRRCELGMSARGEAATVCARGCNRM